MRRLVTLLLMACFGILIPTAASPLRVCYLESAVHLAGFESFGFTHAQDGSQKAKCCPDCGEEGDEGDPCCVEIHKLPDALDAPHPFGLPPVLPVELKDYALRIERPADNVVEVFSATELLRGPPPRAVRRALLGIWNI